MREFLVLLTLFVLKNGAFAQSTISAVKIASGRVLSVDIVDDPAQYPFSAAEIWNWIAGDSSERSVKTEKFQLQCSTQHNVATNSTFGNCNIQIQIDACRNNFTSLSCGYFGTEADQILKGLKPISVDVIVRSPQDQLIFQASQATRFVGLVIAKSLIH